MNIKASLSRRLREIRQELYGDHGGPEMARQLTLPARTWYNYETGVTVPAEVLLAFIEQTGANPLWLLSGEGQRFRPGTDDRAVADLTPIELIRRGLEKLEQDTGEVFTGPADVLSGAAGGEFVAVGLVPLGDLSADGDDASKVDGYIMAYRRWLPNPKATVGARLDDDSMNPILPSGSIVAVDRSVTDPNLLHGRIVAARPEGRTLIRWLDVSDRHLILRPNQPSRSHPLIPIRTDDGSGGAILGQVVWSWSRFSQD